jgi:uncharacterized Zn-binding protein involved in type VI secretion
MRYAAIKLITKVDHSVSGERRPMISVATTVAWAVPRRTTFHSASPAVVAIAVAVASVTASVAVAAVASGAAIIAGVSSVDIGGRAAQRNGQKH